MIEISDGYARNYMLPRKLATEATPDAVNTMRMNDKANQERIAREKAEAMETVDLVRQVEFDALFTFIFSPRPGTPAAKMDDPVPRAEKQKWFDMLCNTQNEISARLHAGYVGRTLRVLVDGETDDARWPLSARTAGGRLVHLVGDKSALAQYRDVKITDSNTWALFGEMLPASKERCSFDA